MPREKYKVYKTLPGQARVHTNCSVIILFCSILQYACIWISILAHHSLVKTSTTYPKEKTNIISLDRFMNNKRKHFNADFGIDYHGNK